MNYSDEIINTVKLHLTNTTKQNHYNGWNNRTLYGYHSFKIDNIEDNVEENNYID